MVFENISNIKEEEMIDFYFIRHAECVTNTKPEIVGGRSNESPLTDKGWQQSCLLGQRFRAEKIKFDFVHCSSAKRAYSTALVACDTLNFPTEKIIVSDHLLELSQGDWEGRKRIEVYTPEVYARVTATQPDFCPPNGESQRQVEARMSDYVYKNFIHNPLAKNATIGIFTHGMAIKCFLRGVLDSDPKMTYRIVIDNTGITRLIFDEKGWEIMSINDAYHLRD